MEGSLSCKWSWGNMKGTDCKGIKFETSKILSSFKYILTDSSMESMHRFSIPPKSQPYFLDFVPNFFLRSFLVPTTRTLSLCLPGFFQDAYHIYSPIPFKSHQFLLRTFLQFLISFLKYLPLFKVLHSSLPHSDQLIPTLTFKLKDLYTHLFLQGIIYQLLDWALPDSKSTWFHLANSKPTIQSNDWHIPIGSRYMFSSLPESHS